MMSYFSNALNKVKKISSVLSEQSLSNKYQDEDLLEMSVSDSKKELFRSVLKLSQLQDDWDGYGAVAFEIETLKNSLKLIDSLSKDTLLPDMMPTNNGTIEFIWEDEYSESSLEVGMTRYSFYKTTTGKESQYLDGPVGDMFSSLKGILPSVSIPLSIPVHHYLDSSSSGIISFNIQQSRGLPLYGSIAY